MEKFAKVAKEIKKKAITKTLSQLPQEKGTFFVERKRQGIGKEKAKKKKHDEKGEEDTVPDRKRKRTVEKTASACRGYRGESGANISQSIINRLFNHW